MKRVEKIFENGDHKWSVVARDPKKPDYLIDTNEYIIQKGSDTLLTDPGGSEIFPAVFSAVTDLVDAKEITHLFASHQDPDIISSLALWMELTPDVKCYLSRLWTTFVPHFGGTDETFVSIPDEGKDIFLSDLILRAVPAHYLHSSGNFNLYDAEAKILFSGDLGAAMIPHDQDYLFVDDFDQHIKYAEGFHRRWMGSNSAKNDWCARVRELDIEMMCPQHGAIYRGENVTRFIDWFESLEVGLKTL
ncbi:MAG: FprA family A-type flavoprotein [Gammaproteobacteria bacterium]|nr:FprA family A-type flavoprotein [Gammaproteobacteria bacterium]